ncbi:MULTISPECIES: hypothetical protein [Halorussus]|uniref:hypothetical protein n=1 Tax=Halorussus TaxID=1070314 RepID=UPI0013B4608D|nr:MULTISPECIES: hypothetical protein [Halorussus]NHN60440.1 hypothetical protein [Halorussus sp. JP-T4]
MTQQTANTNGTPTNQTSHGGICDVPGYDELPKGLQDCADLMHRRGYDIWVAHRTDGEKSLTADRDESSVAINHTTDGQWYATAEEPDSPTLDEMWEDSWRVAAALRNWIDNAGLDGTPGTEDVADGFREIVDAAEIQDGWRVIEAPIKSDEIEYVTTNVACEDYYLSIHYRGSVEEHQFVTYHGTPGKLPKGLTSDDFGLAVTEAIQIVTRN